ncbi:MAG TPA: gluconokinase [Caldimonas sp.]|nr:gluconokinase [Caldimonas sp.]
MAEESPLPSQRRLAVVVMGVSGSGKSTVAAGIAGALGLHFIDGDELHSPASVAKMHAGTPLQDDDRWHWLDRIGACLADAARWPRGVAVACSALKRSYRERIRRAAPVVHFVFLDGSAALIESRMERRAGHYMPRTLLASQLQTLEPPGDDEADVLRMSIELPAAEIVRRVTVALPSVGA